MNKSAYDAEPRSFSATRFPIWLRFAFWISIAIAVAVVLRRIYALAFPSRSGPPQMLSLDNVFASHATLTLAHIIPALLLVLLAPLIVYQSVKPPTWAERAFYPLGAIVGVTAYAMSVYSVGGWTERTAVLLFNSLFLFSLVRAWFYRSRNDTAQQHRWQLRAIAILLGIATTRPVMGVFFATSGLTHLVPQQFFGIAFWIGFSINVFVFELWMRFVDRRHKSAASLQIHLSQSRT